MTIFVAAAVTFVIILLFAICMNLGAIADHLNENNKNMVKINENLQKIAGR